MGDSGEFEYDETDEGRRSPQQPAQSSSQWGASEEDDEGDNDAFGNSAPAALNQFGAGIADAMGGSEVRESSEPSQEVQRSEPEPEASDAHEEEASEEEEKEDEKEDEKEESESQSSSESGPAETGTAQKASDSEEGFVGSDEDAEEEESDKPPSSQTQTGGTFITESTVEESPPAKAKTAPTKKKPPVPVEDSSDSDSEPPAKPKRVGKRPVIVKPRTGTLKERAILGLPLGPLSPRTLVGLVEDLERDRAAAAEKHDFRAGAQAQAALERIDADQQAGARAALQKQTMDDLDRQDEDLKQEIESFNKMAQKEARRAARAAERARNELKRKHEAQLQAHAKVWSEDRAQQYSRASTQLTRLRRDVEVLLAANRFEEAERVQALVKAVEADESKKAVVRRQRDYDDSLARLQARHRREMAVFEAGVSARDSLFWAEQAVARRSLDARRTKLVWMREDAADADKLWARRQHTMQWRWRFPASGGEGDDEKAKARPRRELKVRTTIPLPPLALKVPSATPS